MTRTEDVDELRGRWKSKPWASHLADATRALTCRAATSWSLDEIPAQEDGLRDLRGLALSPAKGASVPGVSARDRKTAVWTPKVANLDGKVLKDVDLSFSLLPNLQAHETTFQNVRFDATNLYGLEAPSARFVGVAFRNVDFVGHLGWTWGPKGRRPEFERCTFEECRFVNAEIRDAEIRDCRFTNTRFGDLTSNSLLFTLAGTRVERCVFENCDFDLCILRARGENFADGGFIGCVFDDCRIVRPSTMGTMTLEDLTWRANEVLVVPGGYRAAIASTLDTLKSGGQVPGEVLKRVQLEVDHAQSFKRESVFLTKEHFGFSGKAAEVVWKTLKNALPSTGRPAVSKGVPAAGRRKTS